MPLMVDSSGYPVYANTPSASLYAFTATVAVDSAKVSVFADTTEQITISATSTVLAAVATNNVTKAILENHKAIQAKLDNQTPRNLMLTWLGLVLLVVLLVHPRFFARVMASMHRPKRHSSGIDTPPCSATPLQRDHQIIIGGGDLRTGWLLREGKAVNPFALDNASLKPPPHITPLLHHLPFSWALLYAPFAKLPRSFSSRATLSELYIIVAYLVVVAFALIWRSDISPTTETKGYGYDFMRTGLTAMAHIPWAVALGVRGNLVGLCVGKGYERLKRLHKIVGRVLFLAATLHTFFWIHKFAVAGVLSKSMTKPIILTGLVAWFGIVVIAVTSLPQVRTSCYGLFKGCHIAGMLMLLIGMCYHIEAAIPWCVASLAIYGFSILCSITKTRLAHAEFVALTSKTTVITVPTLRSGWRAGQHVRIRVPALGGRAGFEAHPFTIASAPNTQGLVLMCKVAGDWTQQLFDFASKAPSSDNARLTATIVLEGPFGGLGNTLLPSFSAVVVTAGGSGITHALSLAHDLVTRAPSGVVRARTIDLVWTVPTQELARPLMPTLIDMVEDARAFENTCLEGRKVHRNLPPPVALRIHVHVTRCPSSSPITLLENKRLSDPFSDPKGDWCSPIREKGEGLMRSGSSAGYYTCMSEITIVRNRPGFDMIINDVANEVIDRAKRERTDPSGVCVTACGPGSMVDSVRNASRKLEEGKRRELGGIEYEEEHFGL